MIRSRRILLAEISGDPAKRAAWEVLVGKVDWAKAERLERQKDEPFGTDPDHPEAAMPNMRGADMVLTAEAGLLADMTGGRDRLAEIRVEVDRMRADMERARAAEAESMTDEERAAIDAHRAALIAEGWTEDAQGDLWSPETGA